MTHILAIGDCNTSGIKEFPEDNIGNALVTALQEKGHPATLTNTAQAMYTTREGLNHARLITEKADILLLNFGLVDAWITSIPNLYVLYFPTNPLRKFFRKILKSFKKRIRHPAFQKFIPRGNVVPLPEYLDNMRAIIALIRRNSPDIHIIIWNTPPTQSNLERNEAIRHYNAALKDLTRKLDTTYIDTETLFKSHKTEDIYLDEVHITKTAQAMLARHIVEKIEPEA